MINSQILDKRTSDVRQFDINCTALLQPIEIIQSITNIRADQGAVIFGTPVINASPITYPDGFVAAVGKVVQVVISGGTIPANQTAVSCTVRALLVTNINTALEATVILRLVDTLNV